MLVTACELGIFDALSQRPLPLELLAKRLHCNPRALQLLLQLLVSAGYLRKCRGRYHNSRMTQRWLTSRSPVSIVPYVIWDHLPKVVRERGRNRWRHRSLAGTSTPASFAGAGAAWALRAAEEERP